jgi:hypothetical protein
MVCAELELGNQPFVVSPMALASSAENDLMEAISNAAQPDVGSTDFLKEREI